MTRRLSANNFVTTLASDISSGATSISITSATGFPSVGSGAVANITIANGSDIEILTCTAISGTTLTVTRGSEGTTPTAFVTGSTVSIRPTKEGIDRKLDEDSYTTTATAAGTTTLTVNSDRKQFFTGSTTQTVVLPVTSTLALGRQFYIVNNSSGVVTVQSSGANTIVAMAASTWLEVTCILTSGTGTASWDYSYGPNASGITGTGSLVRATSPTLVTPALGTIASGDLSAGTGSLTSLTTITTSADITVNSLKIGKSGGNIATNTALGVNALASNTTGSSCVGIGNEALAANTTAFLNTAVGSSALAGATTGTNNTAMGGSAISGVTTGSGNFGMGTSVGRDIPAGGVILTTGSNNIFIGTSSTSNAADSEGTIAIGKEAVVHKATGATSGHNGPGIAIGSSSGKVGFRGDGSIYPGNLWRVNVNGTHYMIPLAADGSTALPVANGGTNATSASITAFNNITGYSAAGATGTTSTNLVFSTSPTLTTPVISKANGTESANAVTASAGAGVITTSSLSTAAGGSYVITWTNTAITSTSVISLTWMGGTNTTQPITFEVVPGSGSATLTIYNDDLVNALNGTVLIGFIVV